ncbi:MAG: D-cysteine desulfhydrase family protein [Arenicella sp.]
MNTKQRPKADLGFFPTPLMALPNLSAALNGPTIFTKRDDQTGLALGGNKTRKLQYILGDAISQGCDCIITAGAAQSNHCRQTAAAAAQQQLECHLVLGGTEPDVPSGNVLLDKVLGCHIHWAGKHRKGEDIPQIYQQLKDSGKTPYIVPYGGSNELGALAFVDATQELLSQSQQLSFTHIIFASSSGGTHAGLMVGKQLFGKDYQLIGINIDKGETDQIPFDQHILDLANRTADELKLNHQFKQDELILNSNYVGDGYGKVGDLEREAIALTARTEGILVDPVYTGRAMGGLIDMIRSGEINSNDTVLFWHTGGAPALFAYSDQLNFM